MPEPLFESRTTRFELPLLFAGQAQKEIFVNELAARLDALLHGAIEAELAVPPISPSNGQAWLVASGASGEWSGKAGQIAARQAGNWLFFVPRDGIRVLNRATGQDIRFKDSWLAAARPATPSGGSTIDSEARTAINAILGSLSAAGIIPPS